MHHQKVLLLLTSENPIHATKRIAIAIVCPLLLLILIPTLIVPLFSLSLSLSLSLLCQHSMRLVQTHKKLHVPAATGANIRCHRATTNYKSCLSTKCIASLVQCIILNQTHESWIINERWHSSVQSTGLCVLRWALSNSYKAMCCTKRAALC